MKAQMISLLSCLLFSFASNAQSRIENLLKQKRYSEVIAFADQTDKLSGQDIFHIGQAYIMQKDDEKAIEMFNKAINKGYKNGEVYFAKGIAQSNLEFYQESINSFRQALYYLPKRKKVLIELAASYYKAQELDSAYSVYQTIEKNWGDYYPAILMTCQILHEQERYTKALDCYYTKLHILQRDDFYHKQALEAVMRLEWHQFSNYPKAELAIKNLLARYPENYQYSMLLMQLYNYTGRYADASILESSILDAYTMAKLPRSYYTKGAMVVDQFDSAHFHIEAYRNFQPHKENGIVYHFFLFNATTSRPIGDFVAIATDSTAFLQGYTLDSANVRLETIDYAVVKKYVLKTLFLTQPDALDSISQF